MHNEVWDYTEVLPKYTLVFCTTTRERPSFKLCQDYAADSLPPLNDDPVFSILELSFLYHKPSYLRVSNNPRSWKKLQNGAFNEKWFTCFRPPFIPHSYKVKRLGAVFLTQKSISSYAKVNCLILENYN